MYLLDEKLIKRIGQIAEAAAAGSDNSVRYEEYIALPYYGQVILRFDLDKAEVTLDEIDSYENMLYGLVGDEFLVDFMGSVYKKAGVDLGDPEALFTALSTRLADESIEASIHAAGINEDAKYLLNAAGLDPDKKVWEIQLEDDSFMLLILGEQNKKLMEMDIGSKLIVGEVNERACEGLIKAAFHAKRNRISLARVLMSAY